ncbi:hypothetical protein RRF57_012952 [Xylaria bambusicola]|uniref:Uncharacterized protein n=1 Tax=Xylaria bambusicola TaxID=326684 RepID=A0AAN7V164_9PEZI
MGYQAAVTALPISVAAYTPPLFGNTMSTVYDTRMISRNDKGYNGRGSRPLSEKYPVTKITNKPKTEIGKFKSWA